MLKNGCPKDGATRQATYRERQAKIGRKGRLMFLTDAEKRAVDKLVRELRAQRKTPETS